MYNTPSTPTHVANTSLPCFKIQPSKRPITAQCSAILGDIDNKHKLDWFCPYTISYKYPEISGDSKSKSIKGSAEGLVVQFYG